MLLEKGEQSSPMTKLADDLPLFQAFETPEVSGGSAGPDPLEEALNGIDADALAPKDALELIYRLKNLLNSGK